MFNLIRNNKILNHYKALYQYHLINNQLNKLKHKNKRHHI
jgi:hypothetical protein